MNEAQEKLWEHLTSNSGDGAQRELLLKSLVTRGYFNLEDPNQRALQTMLDTAPWAVMDITRNTAKRAAYPEKKTQTIEVTLTLEMDNDYEPSFGSVGWADVKRVGQLPGLLVNKRINGRTIKEAKVDKVTPLDTPTRKHPEYYITKDHYFTKDLWDTPRTKRNW